MALQPGSPEGGSGGISNGTSFQRFRSPAEMAPFPLEAIVNVYSFIFGRELANMWVAVVAALKITSCKTNTRKNVETCKQTLKAMAMHVGSKKRVWQTSQ